MPVKNVFVLLLLFFIAILTGCKSSKGPDLNPPPIDSPASSTSFKNPLLSSGPDPWVVQKDGFYYYTQTSGDRIKLWKTRHIDELNRANTVTVWIPPTGTNYSNNIWAPELQFVDGKWYIYFAADNGSNETHRIYALENEAADPTTGTWTFKGKVAAATDKWAIDASVFTYNGTGYITWSGWQGDRDGEQDIYIAKLSNPYTIEGDRVLISKPTYDWEKNNQTIWVNEGPEGLVNSSGKLFLTYSAGACWTDDYCLGLLFLKDGGDPLNPDDWTKTPTPVFTKNPWGGAYGPGHNGFFKSPDSTQDWIIYHANPAPDQGCGDARSPRTQPFTWKSDGTPNFGTPVSLDALIKKPSGE